MRYFRLVYDAPFIINEQRNRALVVGAGTGNDVQAALRNNYRVVQSVDIDGRIIDIGKQLHPEQPYADSRVLPVVNDARAFFEQYQGPAFDVVCYGLLDSHAMFSAMSSLRLDNYVYTEEGIRRAWAHVADGGHLSLSFSLIAGDWIAERIYWTIERATGSRPVAFNHGLHEGITFVVAKPTAELAFERIAAFPQVTPVVDPRSVRTTSDDWPFLYIRPDHFPWGYVLVLTAVLLLGVITVPLAFGARAMRRDFDLPMFLMGSAFLLIETRGVTSLSLLFGSTWVVNAAVFSSIVIVALIANICVERFKLRKALPWFVPLTLSVVALWWLNPGDLNQYPLLLRGTLGGLLNALPIGFAGIIVSILLARSNNPSASLGSNLLGAVLGGCVEYLSMLLGLKALVLIALSIYLLALWITMRGTTRGTPPRTASLGTDLGA